MGWVLKQKKFFEKKRRDVSRILFTYWCHKCLLGPKTASPSPHYPKLKSFVLVVPQLDFMVTKRLMCGVANVVKLWTPGLGEHHHHPGNIKWSLYFLIGPSGHRPLSFCITCVKMLSLRLVNRTKLAGSINFQLNRGPRIQSIFFIPTLLIIRNHF